MMLPNLHRLAVAASVAFLLGGAPGGQAQAPARGEPSAPAAPPAPPTTTAPATPTAAPGTLAPRPERTTATYGDWVLRCELQPGGERSCEVAQTVLDQRNQTLAQMVARHVVPSGPIIFSVQVGANATVAEPLRLVLEAQAALTLPFRRCLPRGCFAETQFSEAELGTLLRGAEPARLEFVDGEGQPVAIPASLRGLTGSLQALRTADRN